MTYLVGGPIQAADYNAFILQINSLYGDENSGAVAAPPADYGYGKLPNLPTVAIGDAVTASDWTALFSRASLCCTHQGTPSQSLPSSVAVNTIIQALPALSSVLADLETNRLILDPTQSSLVMGTTATSATSWTTGRSCTWQADFGSWDSARYFFNTGGSIGLAGSYTGGSEPPIDLFWASLLANMGTVSIKALTSSPAYNNKGFYMLTTSYQEVYRKTSGAYGYSGAYISIEAKYASAAGTDGLVDFRINLYDSDPTPNAKTGTLSFTPSIIKSSLAIPYTGISNITGGTFAGGVSGLSLSTSPSSATSGISGAGTATTNSVTAIPSGGTPPYTYAWTNLTAPTVTINSPTAATSSFSKVLASGETFSGNLQCQVTDAALATAVSVVPWTTTSTAPIVYELTGSVAGATGKVGQEISTSGGPITIAYMQANPYAGPNPIVPETINVTINSGTLPPGLSYVYSISTQYGGLPGYILTGVPTLAGNYLLNITCSGVSDRSNPYSASGVIQITINP